MPLLFLLGCTEHLLKTIIDSEDSDSEFTPETSSPGPFVPTGYETEELNPLSLCPRLEEHQYAPSKDGNYDLFFTSTMDVQNSALNSALNGYASGKGYAPDDLQNNKVPITIMVALEADGTTDVTMALGDERADFTAIINGTTSFSDVIFPQLSCQTWQNNLANGLEKTWRTPPDQLIGSLGWEGWKDESRVKLIINPDEYIYLSTDFYLSPSIDIGHSETKDMLEAVHALFTGAVDANVALGNATVLGFYYDGTGTNGWSTF